MLITIFVGCAFIGILIWRLLILKYQKRSVWMASNWAAIFSIAIFGFVGWKQLVFSGLAMSFVGLTYGSHFISPSVITDTIDYDELINNRRQEATHYGLINYFVKIGMGLVLSLLYFIKLPIHGVPQNEST